MAGSPSHLNHSLNTGEWLELLDGLNIGAFMADEKRLIRAINYTAQAIMEEKADALIGKDCRDIFTGVRCTRACVFSKDYRAVDGHDMPVTEMEKNGRHILTRFAAPVYDANGQLTGCLTILQDHSPIYDLIDRVHYEERSLKMTLDNLDIGIYTVNRGGLITFFNDAAERISGYSRDIWGKNMAGLAKHPWERMKMNDCSKCHVRENVNQGSVQTQKGGCFVCHK